MGPMFRDIFERRIYSPLFDFIVSDDKHPNDLIKGHLNKSINKAVGLGIDLIKAINMVTINPAYHYNLNCGAIVPGAKADFIIVDSIYDCNVLKTYVGGECVFDGVTKKATAKLYVKDGVVQPDIYQDILKIAVVERYGGNTIANAFIKGFGLKKGAIASSVAHDSHNIIVIGYNSQMMADAVNQVIDDKGGISVVSEDLSDSLPLPIAGLMSNEDVYDVADKLGILHNMVKALGCQVEAPFMTMAFMALLVIPSIKISDKGLFDGDNFEFMDVIIK